MTRPTDDPPDDEPDHCGPQAFQEQKMTAAGRGLVLVVEDEAAIAEVIELYLRRGGVGVQIESDGEAALTARRRLRAGAGVFDIRVAGRGGAGLCPAMAATGGLAAGPFRAP